MYHISIPVPNIEVRKVVRYNLQTVLSEAVQLNQSIPQFLKFSTCTDCDDLNGFGFNYCLS